MLLTFIIFLTICYTFLSKQYKKAKARSRLTGKKRLLIILGSGGHTQEMILMAQKMDFKKVSHLYLVSSPCDPHSEQKFLALMSLQNASFAHVGSVVRLRIPRTNRPMGEWP